MGKKPLVVLGSVIIALIVIGGIATLRSRPGGKRPPAPPVATQPPGALRLAPDIAIVMYQGQDVVGGNEVALSSLWETKHQPVILNFWAGLCPPCRAEMPDFQKLYDTHAKGKFTLIGVDIGPFIGLGSREDGQVLLQELKITFPVGTTFDARTVRNYEIIGMPTTVFITTDGKILRKHAGLLTLDQMKEFTDELLRVSPR